VAVAVLLVLPIYPRARHLPKSAGLDINAPGTDFYARR
jgi:hypothetical protein